MVFVLQQRLLHEEGQDRNDEILIEEAEQRHETKRTNNGIVDYTSEPKDETTPGREYEYQVISRQPELQDDNLDSNPQCHVASADSEPQCHDETWCAQQTERKRKCTDCHKHVSKAFLAVNKTAVVVHRRSQGGMGAMAP